MENFEMNIFEASRQSSLLLHEEQHYEHREEDAGTHSFADSTHPKSPLERPSSNPPPEKLFRQNYMLVLVSLYSSLSVVAWVTLCIQNYKPITTHTYSYVSNADDVKGTLAARMKRNAEWFLAAKVLITITNTLIIPLTSTVCASAAVIYVQNFGCRRNFSMQQTSTLADKGWTSPDVWLTLLSVEGWKSQGSYFLAFAIVFHVLGFTIAPLQQYYIGQESFKFQTVSSFGLRSGTDVPDLFSNDSIADTQFPTALLRNELASISTHDFQPDLWQEGTLHCAPNASSRFQVPEECLEGGTTFADLSSLLGTYIAQLPAGYQTGLITQFMPRMNSSVSYTKVSEAEFPPNCDTIPGAYYTDFIYNKTVLNLQVCMPHDMTYSPWNATRDRQDISETMFLHASYDDLYNPVTLDLNPPITTFKLVVHTTLGYFELPNYNNSGLAGPLLAKDPHDSCKNNTDQCLSQWQSKRSLQVNESNSSFEVSQVANLGPLAMMALALFDPGSFIATQFNQTVIQKPDRFTPMYSQPAVPCTVPPLTLLLGGVMDTQPYCYPTPFSADEGYDHISSWLSSFFNISKIENALYAGIIIASHTWLRNPSAPSTGSLRVQYDLGADSVRPRISSSGVIILSILLAIDLILLLGVATYISSSYTWTKQFDASAMMRQGAARADDFPLHIISSHGKERNMRVLEQMPGWVGDAKPDDAVGVLAIGAETPLRPDRRYLGR